MKITMQLSKAEAQKILAAALSGNLPDGRTLRVTEVSWTTYGQTVEIEATDEPEPKDVRTEVSAKTPVPEHGGL